MVLRSMKDQTEKPSIHDFKVKSEIGQVSFVFTIIVSIVVIGQFLPSLCRSGEIDQGKIRIESD